LKSQIPIQKHIFINFENFGQYEKNQQNRCEIRVCGLKNGTSGTNSPNPTPARVPPAKYQGIATNFNGNIYLQFGELVPEVPFFRPQTLISQQVGSRGSAINVHSEPELSGYSGQLNKNKCSYKKQLIFFF
jgi:hypothetical protein